MEDLSVSAKMAALTNEEIAYTPVINRDSVTDTKRGTVNRLQLALCIVLVINVIIQFIAIFTPGWIILTTSIVSSYESVYYSTGCVNINESAWECRTISFHDSFRQDYSDAKDERRPALVRAYNYVVRYQMNIQIAWLLTVGTMIFQIFKLTRRKESFPRVTIINVVALACVCPLMYQVLFKNFVEIDFNRRVTEFVTGDVGFPYSFFFYIFTFVMTIASLILIVKQVYDHIREKDRIYAQMKVKYDRLQLEYEAEVEAFKRFRRNSHLRPHSGDRRSREDDRGSHSPRHSREIKDNGKTTLNAGPHDNRRDPSPRRPDHYPRSRDHSPRPRDRSPPRNNYRGNHSSRNRSPPRDNRGNRLRDHSPRTRDRSPPREHSTHSTRHSPRPRNRSPPRENHGNRPSRNRSPPKQDRGNHSPRNRSPPREDRERHSSRNRSPPREDRGHHSLQNSGEHDNPALVVTPPLEEHSEIGSKFGDTSCLTPLVDTNKVVGVEENGTNSEDIELSIS
ncbi:uncharacterized protein LOC123550278 [Mercenaria mercenaria]|uniref:uncharacterized protein LOC123550278 n=1 Tax=Mercenaria mercenaria TaxID=6596 RepID=UPI00234F5D63|nr:uncharacterized protein LOC123550278 [Mercenaria mercenaria]